MSGEDLPNELTVPVVLLDHARGRLPEYQTSLSAGMDLLAVIDTPVTIEPGARVMVPTGIKMALPEGYEGQVRPRSGLAWRHGVTVLNSPGTIDADYRGEVKVVLVNHGTEPFSVQPGDRIAQLVVAPVVRAVLVEAKSLPSTQRGEGGYGSTGIR